MSGMAWGALIERFSRDAPVATMVRGLLANILSREELDAIFRDAAERQYEDELLFSSVVELLGLVVSKAKPSLHAAYQTHREQLGVSVQSLYNKVNGTEPQVVRELVSRTAEKMRAVIAALAPRPGTLEGYELRILDGSHLAATQHRLQELRTLRGGPLPGQALVVLDPRLGLITDLIPCEDGHAQERSLLPEWVDLLQPNQLWIADRNFCTRLFLHEIALNKAFFLVRQHAGLSVESRGERRAAGRTQEGRLWEEDVAVPDGFGQELLCRRITLELDVPTANGERTIQLLTNLPPEVTAATAADEYRSRWGIEQVFGELTLALHGEIETLGYPRGALLAYAIALVTYNVLSVVRAALRVAHGAERVEQEVSFYYLADEVSGVSRGLEIAIPAGEWTRRFAQLEPQPLAQALVTIARHADLRRYLKHPRPAKKPPPKRKGARQHVSTAKVLSKRQR